MTSLGGIFCLATWGLIIFIPIWISYSLSRSGIRQRFCDNTKKLHGTIISRTKEVIEVELPGSPEPIRAAFFCNGTHWYGKDTLEVHFPLISPSPYEFSICSLNPPTHLLPPGWTSKQVSYNHWNAILSAPTQEALDEGISLGIEPFFGQFRQTQSPTACRVSVESDVIKFFVRSYSVGLSNYTSILQFGNKFTQQINMLVDGTIQLSESTEEPTDKICPICSCPVEIPRNCTKCQTPHCSECWSYNSYSCGVFGCGGTMK